MNNDTHGYEGPIAISNGGTTTALAHDFLRASDSLGIPFSGTSLPSSRGLIPNSFSPTDDIQDLQTSHASELWAKYVNRHTGRRSDAATAYVHSVMDVQSNLYLRTDARVNRVIFEDKKAVGVAYVPARNRGDGGKLIETIVRARKCVVLSAGTLGTPQILERSGVGNKELLGKLDINVVSNLPGVGEEYQDHYTTLSSQYILFIFGSVGVVDGPPPNTVYRVSNESTTADAFLRGVPEVRNEVCIIFFICFLIDDITFISSSKNGKFHPKRPVSLPTLSMQGSRFVPLKKS